MDPRTSLGAIADRDFHAVLRSTQPLVDGPTPDPEAVQSHAMALLGLGRPQDALDILTRAELGGEGSLLAAKAAVAAGREGAATHLVAALRKAPSLVGEALEDPNLATLFSSPEVLAWLSSLS